VEPIDVAPLLELAAVAIDDARWEEANARLLEAWTACRCARIARAVAAVDLRLPPPVPLSEKRVNRREHEWLELVKAGDDESLRRALAAPWPAFPSQAGARVGWLEERARPSARISNALIALHRSSLFTSAEGVRVSRQIFHYLIKQNDHAIVEEIERLEKLPQEATRLGSAVLRRRRPLLPDLSPAGEGALARIEQLLSTPRDTARDRLLDAIYEAPHDDGPRVVYADALTLEGDPRGEFITLQIQRGRDGEPTKREKQLLKAAGRTWLDGLDGDGATKIVHARGFPAEATLASGETRAPGWATVEKLFLFDRHVFVGAMHMRGLRELHDLGVAQLPTATLPSYDLEVLSVRDYEVGLHVETPFAPRVLGLARPNEPAIFRDVVPALRTMPVARRVETVRLGTGLRQLDLALALANHTGFAIELAGGYALSHQNQWAARVAGTQLRLHWAGEVDAYGDVAYESIVPILTALPRPAIEAIEVTAVAQPNPAVRPALVRLLESWPRLRSARILTADDLFGN